MCYEEKPRRMHGYRALFWIVRKVSEEMIFNRNKKAKGEQPYVLMICTCLGKRVQAEGKQQAPKGPKVGIMLWCV